MLANCVESDLETIRYYMQAQREFDYVSTFSDYADEDVCAAVKELSADIDELHELVLELEAADRRGECCRVAARCSIFISRCDSDGGWPREPCICSGHGDISAEVTTEEGESGR